MVRVACARLASERERLAKLLPGADPNGPIAHRLQVLDVQMETDRLKPVSYTHLTLPTSDLV